jgi:hypothetical protein
MDTEFCNHQLIQLAMVEYETGEPLNMWNAHFNVDYMDQDLNTDWVKKNVMQYQPPLEERFEPRDMRQQITSWWYHHVWTDVQIWAWYGCYDYWHLCELFGGFLNRPQALRGTYKEIAQLYEGQDEVQKPINYEPHNALSDAYWARDLMMGCSKWNL